MGWYDKTIPKQGGGKMDIQKLKAALVEAGETQRSFSKKAHMSLNTINAKLNGNVKITLDDVYLFSEILNLSRERMCEIFLP